MSFQSTGKKRLTLHVLTQRIFGNAHFHLSVNVYLANMKQKQSVKFNCMQVDKDLLLLLMRNAYWEHLLSFNVRNVLI